MYCNTEYRLIFDTIFLKDVDKVLVTLQPPVPSYVAQSQAPLTRTRMQTFTPQQYHKYFYFYI
jgi:hypothetical protein